ncbi:MAG: GNAT family N-acetyltransferase [Roseiflexaceae bacterium]|nr:GNAT family N-acetyltransferase [Roseiflexaceae bacterium]
MQIRKYRPGEELALWELFHSTIHHVNIADYSIEQVNAWAPDQVDTERWRERIAGINPFVVEHEGQIIGYADIQPSGYIDHFYVHYQWQRRGVGTLLMQQIHAVAEQNQITRLFSQVSITARPFFEAWGFSVEAEQVVQARGVTMTNFRMSK